MTPKVRSLEWAREQEWRYRASSLVGDYVITDALVTRKWVWRNEVLRAGNNGFDTAEAAQASAQADYDSRILSALEPTTDEGEGWERETGWLLEQPAAHGHGPLWFYLGKDDGEDGTGWTSDSIAALRFARKQDAESYIADIGWTEIVATEHEWLGPRAPRR